MPEPPRSSAVDACEVRLRDVWVVLQCFRIGKWRSKKRLASLWGDVVH
jgi:hypothetical protein